MHSLPTSSPLARPSRAVACLLALAAAAAGCSGPGAPSEASAPAQGSAAAWTLADVRPGADHAGFRATAAYLDDAREPMGARFVHEHSGFELAYLRIDTAPQGFLWVHTAPETDKGLPHAQEHLLLGKGNAGRHASGVEAMSLVSSSAFTANAYTAYHANAIAGVDVYFDVLAVQLDAFLNPDYTDEEIRREFSHLGVAGEPGALRLEEKGTVYVEMVSSYNKPGSRSWLARQATLHGPEHPKAKSAGGIPAVIRTVEPSDIRRFHREHYRLGNMGLILVLPDEISLGESLDRLDAILRDLQPEPSSLPADDEMPPPRPAPPGTVVVTPYPSSNPNETVRVSFAWPPTLDLDLTELLLVERFLDTLAGDVSTNLYRRFVDAETRTIDVDVRDVWAWVEDRDGHAITIGLSGLRPAEVTTVLVEELRRQVRDELATIAAWEPDDPSLEGFNERVHASLLASEREARDVLNRPPGFGARGLRGDWHGHLEKLERTEGFEKSLTLGPQHQAARRVLDQPGNPWSQRLRAWGLLDLQPYAFTQRPSPELQEEIESSRAARLEAQTRRLIEEHGTDDPRRALAAFQAAYDAATAELERLEERELPPFLSAPPMTLDDFLDHRVEALPGTEVPVLAAHFDGMTGASFSLALPLDGVGQADLLLLPLLPSLLTEVGVVENGVPVPAAEVVQRLRREIQGVDVRLASEPRTPRHELIVNARGVTPDEAARAIEWAALFLTGADWRPENLPRLRDVVDQALDGLRRRTRAREEAWVRDPAAAYRWQRDPLHLATDSFLTARHDALRLRWLLRSPASDAVPASLRQLAALPSSTSRSELLALVAALQAEDGGVLAEGALADGHAALDAAGRRQVAAAARDLEAELPALPDSSLAADWSYLATRIAADLESPPEETLQRLTALRGVLLRAGGVRAWMSGSERTLDELEEPLRALGALLQPGRAPAAPRDGAPLIWTRLAERGVDTTQRTFVGFVEPSLTGGVVQNFAPMSGYEDTDVGSLLDLLAGVSYSGHGPHGLFMRTWGAGLAYSNGIRSSVAEGELRYYAERCPTLAETLTFVAEVLREAEADPALADYAVAQVFRSRAADSYEARTAAMAADLADGRTPERVRAFREAVLHVRERPDLHRELHERLFATTGRVLPGLGPALATVEGGVYHATGTEAQLRAYEEWLREQEGGETVLHLLYPRDHWRMEAVPADR